MDIIILLIILGLMWIIIEVLSIALKMTGLELYRARFQVISLITHTGFTTRESELITQHPTRRRLASILMLVSYIAQVTLISVFLHVLTANTERLWIVIAILVVMGIFIYFVTRNRFFATRVNAAMERMLDKQIMKNIKKQPLEKVLKISPKYGIYELIVDDDSPLCGKSLADARLKDEYIQVLKVDHGSTTTDFPSASLVIESGDKLIVYGKTRSILDSIIKKEVRKKQDTDSDA